MNHSYYRDTWVDIDLDAIAYNVEQMKARLPQEMELLAVVKANGYGHGALQVAQTALAAGASRLAVAILDEALALRASGVRAPILVLSPIRAKDAALAADKRIAVTVFQEEWLREAADELSPEQPLSVHVACDSGMGRIGVRDREMAQHVAAFLQNEHRFVVEGIFTHFATADQNDETYFDEQYNIFQTMVGWFRDFGIEPPLIHCGNSAATLKFPRERRPLFTLVRYGVAMYGLSPSQDMKVWLPFNLRPALSFYSNLFAVKKVAAGSFIGYGATYRAEQDEWIGTVPVGYADGFLRAFSGSDVLIGSERCPIVGRICMDQFMCRLPHEYPIGTRVTLIGSDGEETITIDERAGQLRTINYEVACQIHPRVPRVFIRKGRAIDCVNSILSEYSL
ncbi:MAG: alanine racemase [Sporolactobacillus sp.]